MGFDISVIIPTFNVERYIEEALISVVNQNFSGSIEIIVIDDCSTDRTTEIVGDFKQRYSDYSVTLLHQPQNLRQGTARNRGIKEAKGKYLLFLDGDDFLDEHAFEKMFDATDDGQVDFVVCDWVYYYEDKGLIYVNNDLFMAKQKLVGQECEELLQAPTYFTVNKLYRRNFLINNSIYYGEGYIYEDVEFYIKVANCANYINLISNPLYMVRVNPFSTTKTSKDTNVHLNSFIQAIENSLDQFNPRKEDSYYFVYKYLIRKAIVYAKTRAPKGNLRKTLGKVIELLNNKSIKYGDLKGNINSLDHFLFRRGLIKKQRVNTILFLEWASQKKVLTKIFKVLMKLLKSIKNTSIYKKIKKYEVKKKIKQFNKAPIDNNTILFIGFDYKYIGNSRYFYEFLNSTKSGYQVYFVTRDPRVPSKNRITPRSLLFYEIFAKTKIVFAESWIPLDLSKREETTWIQLWHGTPFKKLLFDSAEVHISKYNRNHKCQKQRDIRRWDYILSDSRQAKEKFKTAFAVEDKKILNFGYPRVQWLKNNRNNQKLKGRIKQKIGICGDKRIILYVPTWRDYNYKQKNPDLSYLLDVNFLSRNLGDGYAIIHKDHSMGVTRGRYNNVYYPDTLTDVQELILIADIIISDYSSVIFDAMAIDIPFYLYINDFEKYEKARGVYWDMHEDMQSFYTKDTVLLIDKIKNEQYANLKQEYQIIKGKYCNDFVGDGNQLLLKKIIEITKS
ncbi:bifunctional glycosyltransferase/CDP-glycerol:glycerophosphate glycerophosphotransferase [Paenibacillus sp. 1001270B_150601_E10]|uniref:bifunctional glycosyltransferase/CDP-glycerol:glycerophosphate glycerophosphotransferase n=1 Tax=Paenibacillus sp. 1001270B_150601_E10 TaxID=2787079 RepID=UPI001E3DA8D4|nr:CDP-glycerol glycerophosphotransferase family protein [Paenibacillus sp. 1001270B_150601_E10]